MLFAISKYRDRKLVTLRPFTWKSSAQQRLECDAVFSAHFMPSIALGGSEDNLVSPVHSNSSSWNHSSTVIERRISCKNSSKLSFCPEPVRDLPER